MAFQRIHAMVVIEANEIEFARFMFITAIGRTSATKEESINQLFIELLAKPGIFFYPKATLHRQI